MNPGSDLDSLPILYIPDKLVVHAYAALTGELLYIAINTVPQLIYSMSCLTRFCQKPRSLISLMPRLCSAISLALKVASLLGAANVYLFHMLSVKFLLMSIQVGLMTRITGAVPWLIISLSITLRFLGVRLFLKL